MFKALLLNKANSLKNKEKGSIKPKVNGLSGVYVAAGNTTWLGGSGLNNIDSGWR